MVHSGRAVDRKAAGDVRIMVADEPQRRRAAMGALVAVTVVLGVDLGSCAVVVSVCSVRDRGDGSPRMSDGTHAFRGRRPRHGGDWRRADCGRVREVLCQEIASTLIWCAHIPAYWLLRVLDQSCALF